MNLWQPQEPLQYNLSEKSHFGYYVTCTVLHEKSKSKIIVTSRVDDCTPKWWGCEFYPKLLAWDSDLNLIKWNALILINPPSPIDYYMISYQDDYIYTIGCPTKFQLR